ncbi:MAG: UbiD family decarboxylase [Candidatus Thorarchaeota archaeon]
MRNYLNQIDVKKCEEVISTNQISKQISKDKEVPTLYKLKNYNFPIASGLISNRELFATALGIKKDQIISFITDKLDKLKKPSKIDKAEFLANKIDVNQNTDLEKYIPMINFYGDKKYVTSSIIIVKFPDEDRQNMSFHRLMYLGANKFAIRIVPQRHLDKAYLNAMEHDIELEIAIVCGVHPAIEICASFSAPQLDELSLASTFLKDLKIFRLSNGLLVPFNAEFVFEGRITKEMADEGPFVDLTGTADIIRSQPILEIDKLYFKNNPIFRTILPGAKEHKILMGVPQEPRMFTFISNTVSTVKNVILTTGGNSWFHAVVQIKKRTEGDAKNTILAALAAHPSLKRVIVVDEDINIYNSDDVEWAVATRVQPDKDILLIPNSKGSSLDPSSKNSITCKWGIDATKPLENNEGYNRVKF